MGHGSRFTPLGGRPRRPAQGGPPRAALDRLGVRRPVHGGVRPGLPRPDRLLDLPEPVPGPAHRRQHLRRPGQLPAGPPGPEFWSGLGRVALFLAVQVPIMLGIALLVALAIDSGRLYGAGFFRIVDLPALRRARRGRHADVGLHVRHRSSAWSANINERVRRAHCPTRSPASWVLASIGNIVTWEFVGYNMLIFYSALRVIPHSLYEAAEIDGAGAAARSSRPSSSRRSAAPSSSRRSSRSSAASSSSTSRASCGPWRRTPSPPTSRPTCTRTRCPSPASSTTTPPPSPSSWALITMVIAYVVQLRGMRKGA